MYHTSMFHVLLNFPVITRIIPHPWSWRSQWRFIDHTNYYYYCYNFFFPFVGCNKCYKEFPRAHFGDKPDFSGFNRSEWEEKTNDECRSHAEIYQEGAKHILTEDKIQLSRIGSRYSAITHLPYYDAVHFTLIDPMHNLFLGTAKHVLNTWVNEGILSSQEQTTLQARVDKVRPPTDNGRLPSKIANGFAGFTADQWKHWICIYFLCFDGSDL